VDNRRETVCSLDVEILMKKSCWCYECVKYIDAFPDVFPGLKIPNTNMILCPHCGNKRCPHATDHRLQCTNSNDPGQLGSTYGIYPHPSKELFDFIEKGSNKT
jgi:hypothetical protein